MNGEALLAYDARFSIGSYRGMGRFTRWLIGCAGREATGLVATGETDPELAVTAGGFRAFPLWEQFSLPRRAAKLGAGYLLCPYNTAPLFLPGNIRLILVVHDLIFMQPISRLPLSSSVYQNFGRAYRRLIVPSAIRRAHAIITVSEFSRREILAFDPNVSAPITVIPNTIHESWFDSEVVPQEPDDVVLCPSGEAPSKNLAVALHAFAQFYQSHNTAHLVITGVHQAKHAEFQRLAAALGIGTQTTLIPYLPERELQRLYRTARVCLLPSLHEGFGIPALEAIALGLPVACSAIPAFEEVLGNAALFFDPASAPDMASKLEQVWRPNARDDLRGRGLVRAKLFHPSRITDKIRQFWEHTLCGT